MNIILVVIAVLINIQRRETHGNKHERGSLYLQNACKSIDKNRKEEQAASRIKIFRTWFDVQEYTPNHNCHEEITKQLCVGESRVSLQTLESTPEAEFHLLQVIKGIWGFDRPI